MPTYTRHGEPMRHDAFLSVDGETVHFAVCLDLWSDEELEAEGVVRHPDPPPSFDQIKAACRASVEAKRDGIFNNDGYTVTEGPLAGHVLQWRLPPHLDRTNWLTSQAAYSAAVAAGQGGAEGATFRTKDNVNITVTYSEGLSTLLAMAAAGQGVVERSWALFDQIDAASSPEDLPSEAVIEQGWFD